MDWVTGIQRAIAYMEDNLLDELDFGEIAKRAYVSSFHFQRVFHVLSGFTLGEYIRNRRLWITCKSRIFGTNVNRTAHWIS